MPVEVLKHDVLVLGGGAAGLRAAIAAAEMGARNGGERARPSIALVSKVYPVRSHTVAAEGGAAGVMREYDSFDIHAQDTIRGSDYLADQDIVETFVREAPEQLIQLEHWGCPWSREPDGRIAVRAFGGMSVKRTVFAADKTGFYMLHTLFHNTLKYPNIVRYDEWFVTSLVARDGRIVGVTALEVRTGVLRLIMARAVIIATGGIGRVFAFTTNAAISTGDGMALAYRAGAALKDMEFVQYHPTGLPKLGILITEASRGEGGYLVNREGERFLQRYAPERMEMAPRDIISRAIISELEGGRGYGGLRDGHVMLDLRHLGRRHVEERLPFVLELARTYVGIDPLTQPIPVRPVVHYMMGGVHTAANGSTTVKGLYACGEAACESLNGANRLGSNSLSECLVFGAHAGRAAMEEAVDAPEAGQEVMDCVRAEAERIEARFLRKAGGNGERVATLRSELQSTMEEGVGIFRTEEGLRRTCQALAQIRDRSRNIVIGDSTRTFNLELTGALEFDFMLEMAEVIARSALWRTESRGAHVRKDFPKRDDAEWLAHTLARRTPEGPRLEKLPVTITRWQPAERKY